MAKRISAVDEMNAGEITVEQLEGLDNQTSADMIANSFEPINYHSLPCYRPVEKPPQVEEYVVHDKIKQLKNTKSTFNIDLPNKVRQEFSVDLTPPLTDIIITSL